MFLAASLVSVAMVAAACGSSAKTSSSSGGSTNQAGAGVKYDQNARMSLEIDQEPTNFNCTSSDGNEQACINVIDRVWPSVFHLYPDFSVHLDSTFMQSATEISQSPQVIEYKINPKAVWSDGTPITFQDFVYNWQAQSGDPQYKDADGKAFAPATSGGYSQIGSVAEGNNDPYDVKVTFKTPYADWQGLFGANDPLVPAHIAQKVGYNDGFTDPVKDAVSGGPFMIQNYTKGQSITLVRNPQYWGTPANLSAVTFRFLTDSSQIVPALQNGEINGGIPTPQLDLVNSLKALSGVKLDQRDGLEFEHLDFNQTNPFLKDPVLRHALMLSIDRKALIAQTVGQYDPKVKPLNDRMYVTNQPGYQDNSGGTYNGADVNQAKQILMQAGYTYDPSGTLMKNGQPVAMRITSTQGNALRQDEEQYVISAVGKIGVKATETDTSGLGDTLSKGNFDMIIFAWVVTPFPSQNDALYATPNAQTGAGASNYSNSNDPKVDQIVAQVDGTADPAARTKLYNQMDTQLWNSYYNLPLFQRAVLSAYQTKYLNIQTNATAESTTYNMEDWGVKAAS